jgi:ABC-type branched-subunit amino acid transport system ATPase component
MSDVTHPTVLLDEEVSTNVPVVPENVVEAIDVVFSGVTVLLVMFVHAG